MASDPNRVIDLSELTRAGEVRNLSGHQRGVAARTEYHLEELDVGDEPVEVRVPTDVYTITPSFFQGMFADSVHHLGNDREQFLAHYHFIVDEVLLQQIERGLSAILTERNVSRVH